MREPDHRVSHEGYASTLWCGAEESKLDLPLLEVICVVFNSLPSVRRNRLLIVVLVSQFHVEICINLDQTRQADLQQRNAFRAKESMPG